MESAIRSEVIQSLKTSQPPTTVIENSQE